MFYMDFNKIELPQIISIYNLRDPQWRNTKLYVKLKDTFQFKFCHFERYINNQRTHEIYKFVEADLYHMLL